MESMSGWLSSNAEIIKLSFVTVQNVGIEEGKTVCVRFIGGKE